MPNYDLGVPGSAMNAVAVTNADIGDTLAHSIQLLNVNVSAGDPASVYITGLYGIATVAGTAIIYYSAAPGTTPRSATAANWVFSIYQSTTGDGLTNIRLGPFTTDVWLTSDATYTCGVGMFQVTYEAVGII